LAREWPGRSRGGDWDPRGVTTSCRDRGRAAGSAGAEGDPPRHPGARYGCQPERCPALRSLPRRARAGLVVPAL